MSAPSDLIEFFKLNAIFDPIAALTREKVRISDRTHRKRQIVAVKEWKRAKRIGRGAYGTVWVERDEEGNMRVVKEIVKENSGMSVKVDHQRELLALGQLSKVRFQAFIISLEPRIMVHSMKTNSSISMGGSRMTLLFIWLWRTLNSVTWRHISLPN